MSLQEKFASLSPEQQEKFKGVKSQSAFDAFLSDSDPSKKFKAGAAGSGKTELSDDDLDAVAGGGGMYGYTDDGVNYIYFKCDHPDIKSGDFMMYLKMTKEDICPYAPPGEIVCFGCPHFSMT